MKATDLLMNQHRDVERLFDQLESVDEGDEARKKSVRDALAASLVAHSIIEKEIFYPAVRSAAPTEIAEAYEEHGAVEFSLYRFVNAQPDDATFEAKMKVLREMVRAHVDMEERELLKIAEGAIGDAQLGELGTHMEARFEQVREEGYESHLERAILEAAPILAKAASAKSGRAASRATTRRAPAKRTTKRAAKRPVKARAGAVTRSKPATKRKVTAPKGRGTAASRAKGGRSGQKTGAGASGGRKKSGSRARG